MKKYVFGAIVLTVAIIIAVLFSQKTVTVTDYAMNTAISITVKSRNPKLHAKKAMDEIKRLDALMSATSSGSDVWKINSAPAGQSVQVSDEVYELIEFSLNISDKTKGNFDISVNPLCVLWDIGAENPKIPSESDIEKAKSSVDYKSIVLNPADKSVTLTKDNMSITLGAVAKGYAADRVAEILRKEGVSDGIIDIGGNIYVIGSDKRIGIQRPFAKRGEYFRALTVSDTSVVTSGPYERYFEKDSRIYHHIIDPDTLYPASLFDAVTILTKDSGLADALSTALFCISEKDGRELLSSLDCEVDVIWIYPNGQVSMTDGIVVKNSR